MADVLNEVHKTVGGVWAEYDDRSDIISIDATACVVRILIKDCSKTYVLFVKVLSGYLNLMIFGSTVY